MKTLANRGKFWRQSRPWAICFVWAFLAAFALAQSEPPAEDVMTKAMQVQRRKNLDLTPEPKLDFGKDDFLRGRVDGGMQLRYFVGEPVVLPLVLANHTKHAITVATDYCPRSSLEILVYQENMPSRVYHGPFFQGMYAPVNITLNPLDEHVEYFVMWSDVDEPTGLFFSQPGQYTINVSQQVSVKEGNLSGKLKLGSATIQIDPTPQALKQFVDDLQVPLADASLSSRSPAYYLQLGKTPPGWEKKLPQYLSSLPPSPLTPYLCLAHADWLHVQWMKAKDPKEAEALAAEAMKYYESAARSNSPRKLDAYSLLLAFTDTLDQSSLSASVAKELLGVMPRDRLGKVGESGIIKKYFSNSGELNQADYWVLYP